jgi:hypothetical protein
MTNDTFVMLRQEDFDRMAKDAIPPKHLLLPIVSVAPDRFGVVPEGRAIMVQVPAAEVSLRSAPFLRDYAEQVEGRIAAMRYGYEMRLPKPTMFVGMDFGIEDSYSVPSRREIWMATWRWSAQGARDRKQRRLDRRSNVRRKKRHAELLRRSVRP